MRPRAEAVLVGVTLLWASTFVVTKDVVQALSPLGFLVVRFGVAALVLLALVGRRGATGALRPALRDGAVLGLLNSSGLVLQVFGQAYTSAAKSSFITSLNTPLTPVVALLLYRTRPSGPQRVAVALASVGVALLTWPGAGARWNLGDLLTVGCATLYAFTIVEMARRTARHPVLPLAAVQVATAALLFLALLATARLALAALPLDRLPEALRLEARPLLPLLARGPLLAEVLYMALACTVVAFLGQTWAMARMSATHAAIVFALEPVFATAMALAFLGAGEWPGARGASGAGLVLLAVVVSELPRRR